jgi:hypothetical protein
MEAADQAEVKRQSIGNVQAHATAQAERRSAPDKFNR